jgi:hypothetical protein
MNLDGTKSPKIHTAPPTKKIAIPQLSGIIGIKAMLHKSKHKPIGTPA